MHISGDTAIQYHHIVQLISDFKHRRVENNNNGNMNIVQKLCIIFPILRMFDANRRNLSECLEKYLLACRDHKYEIQKVKSDSIIHDPLITVPQVTNESSKDENDENDIGGDTRKLVHGKFCMCGCRNCEHLAHL
jgi:hypothetical protein